MASELLSKPIVLKVVLQVYAMKKSLTKWGQPPVGRNSKGQTIVEGSDTDEAIMAALPYIVYILAGIGFCLGGMTMFFFASTLVDFACFMLLIVAPIVCYQKVKLMSLGDLRGQHNALREKCNVFAGENNKLTASINEMEGQMARYVKLSSWGNLQDINSLARSFVGKAGFLLYTITT